jgi:UDP-glucose 4-epimerase
LRYFNVAGNDELQRVYDPYWKEKSNLFPAMMRAYLGYTPDIRLFGTKYKTSDGTAIRDYIHVGDLIDAHIHVLSAILNGHSIRNVYNVGNGKGYTVREVIDSFERVVGPIPVVVAPRREGDPEKLISCPKRIKRDLKFTPKFKHIDDMVRTYAKMICNEPVPGTGETWKEKR